MMATRDELIQAVGKRYQEAGQQQRSIILDENLMNRRSNEFIEKNKLLDKQIFSLCPAARMVAVSSIKR